ncbi:hypothetical protein BH20ACT5_BH20ACT5_04150 [soil metagenome]
MAAGSCWIAKGGAILIAGVQPPVLFEVAPLLMAVAVVGLARQLPVSRVRAVAVTLGVIALAVATPVVADEVTSLPRMVTGAGMALAQICVVVGLAVAGWPLRRRQRAVLPLALATATVPAIVLGGLLMAVLGERALEIPLLALGSGWIVLGAHLARGRYSPGGAEVSG